MTNPFTRKKLVKLFDTWNWRKYVPFWHEQGTPLLDFMAEKKIPFREFNSIFEAHGSDFYEIMKKLTVSRMVESDFNELSDNEKAMLGTTLFLAFMKQLRLEIIEMDSDKG